MSFKPYAQHTIGNQKTFEQVFNRFQSNVVSIRKYSIDLPCKSVGWFLYNDDSELKWVKSIIERNNSVCLFHK